ncbi:MAG: CorA family divalent cation transporter [Candidatus Diapherotrites archaeon]|nr:CorA family divalent cation transporter [Candidatus Diapherotrites archaeon]
MPAIKITSSIEEVKGSTPDFSNERRAFCVALQDNGELIRLENDSPASFTEAIGKSSIAWIDYWADNLDKEIFPIAESLGFSSGVVTTLMANKLAGYEDFDTELGLILPAVNVKGLDVQVSPLVILIRKNLIVTLHGRELKRFIIFRRYAATFIKKLPAHALPNDRLTIILSRIIDESNKRNFDHLREIEDQGDKISKQLLETSMPASKTAPKIYKMKHALITYLNILWASLDVINNLRYGDAELLTDDEPILARVGLLGQDVRSQIGLAEHMSEVLASGLEVLTQVYNNQLQTLNNRLALAVAYMTIIGTAVLVPNTLATILSNSVFNLTPADQGWFIALMIGSTVISVIAVYWWIRKQQWLHSEIKEEKTKNT